MSEETVQNVVEETPEEEERVVYELGYHLVPTLTEEQLPKEVKSIEERVKKDGGSIISEGAPRKINLAYTMKQNIGGSYRHFDDAYFGWIKFEMPSLHVAAFKKELESGEHMLRMLIIKTVREDTTPQKRVFVRPEEQKSVLIRKPTVVEEKAPISEEELDRQIEKMVAE